MQKYFKSIIVYYYQFIFQFIILFCDTDLNLCQFTSAVFDKIKLKQKLN